VLLDEAPAAAAGDATKDERDEHRIVELAGDGDEVRHEVEGHGEVDGEEREEELGVARDPPVPEQPAEENDAVGDEAG